MSAVAEAEDWLSVSPAETKTGGGGTATIETGSKKCATGVDLDRILDSKDRDRFACIVCSNVAENAWTCSEGRLYCETCHIADPGTQVPAFRSRLSLNDVQVSCLFSGCEYTGPFSKRVGHESACSYRPQRCGQCRQLVCLPTHMVCCEIPGCQRQMCATDMKVHRADMQAHWELIISFMASQSTRKQQFATLKVAHGVTIFGIRARLVSVPAEGMWVYARDSHGKSYIAKITDMEDSALYLSWAGWSSRYDGWCNRNSIVDPRGQTLNYNHQNISANLRFSVLSASRVAEFYVPTL